MHLAAHFVSSVSGLTVEVHVCLKCSIFISWKFEKIRALPPW